MKNMVNVLHLYSETMDTYGDSGNVLAFEKYLSWMGYSVNSIDYNLGDDFPDVVDIVFGGGGQNSAQFEIYEDLISIGGKLRDLSSLGVPMMLVCGLYQMFGEEFEVERGRNLAGIGVFDVFTRGDSPRAVGNIVVDSEDFGVLVGYENHFGKTRHLSSGGKVLGRVLSGVGNNGVDGSEGSVVNNTIGTYMHGALLPKNPSLIKFLAGRCLDYVSGGGRNLDRDYGLINSGALDRLEYLSAQAKIPFLSS